MSTAILKKTAKALSAGLISLSVLMTVAFGAVADRFPEGDTAAGKRDRAPLPEPPENLFIPDGNDFIGCENESPTALDVYDGIFSCEEPPAVRGELKIISTDLSRNPSPGTVYVKNNTAYGITPADYLSADTMTITPSASPAPESAQPRVLIYHTHGTRLCRKRKRLVCLKRPSPLPGHHEKRRRRRRGACRHPYKKRRSDDPLRGNARRGIRIQ